MIQFKKESDCLVQVKMVPKQTEKPTCFSGEFLETFWEKDNLGRTVLYLGLGNVPFKDRMDTKEVFAKAAQQVKKCQFNSCAIDVSKMDSLFGKDFLRDAVEGLTLGEYSRNLTAQNWKESGERKFILYGIDFSETQKEELHHVEQMSKDVLFARDMVNLPGNLLRPLEFCSQIIEFMEDVPVETEKIVFGQLKAKGMHGICEIGKSSEFPPCMLVLRYNGNPKILDKTALVGKGVTCDTGGYCIKNANSMAGIKGDMAGGAAVASAIHALAANKVKINVVGVIPMCENRISPSSILPGDVISSYSGKKIEVLNTDAEGRVILADAVYYAVHDEKASRVLDIATLTGAVAGMFGFTIGGVMSDNDLFYEDLKNASEKSGERYVRLPFYREQEKMIKSDLADLKNTGGSVCATITAGLFIHEFTENCPWIHMDIAGTAWVDTPCFEFQSKGATGAGVSTLYYLCAEMEAL